MLLLPPQISPESPQITAQVGGVLGSAFRMELANQTTAWLDTLSYGSGSQPS